MNAPEAIHHDPAERTDQAPVGLTLPPLRDGERYVGAIAGPDGHGHHIIRLPAMPDEPMRWDEAMAFAADQGADLPSRPESALMYQTARDGLANDWYWTNEQPAGDADYAWGQHFGYGFQYYHHEDLHCRVVLVRRVAL